MYYLIGNRNSTAGMIYRVVREFKTRKEAIENHQKFSTRFSCEQNNLDNIGWLVQATSAENAIKNVESRKCKNLWKR